MSIVRVVVWQQSTQVTRLSQIIQTLVDTRSNSLYLPDPCTSPRSSPDPDSDTPWPANQCALLIFTHQLREFSNHENLAVLARSHRHPLCCLAQNAENYLLTPSPQGDLCVAKLFPPPRAAQAGGKYAASDPGHGGGSSSRAVRCEASRNLKWTIANTGVMSPIYKLSLPSPDSPDLPLFQVSKPNPNAAFWSMFYFAYAGHLIPPKRIEFGKIQKNPPGPGGGGTRISITGKTPEEKAVWQTLGEGNEDCVEWVVLCAALNLLESVFYSCIFHFPTVKSTSTRIDWLPRALRLLKRSRTDQILLSLLSLIYTDATHLSLTPPSLRSYVHLRTPL